MRPGRPVVSARRRWPVWAAVIVAAVLHGGAVWLLLPHDAGRHGVALADPPLIEIEMVDQAEQMKGRPAVAAAQPPPAPPAETPPAPAPPPPPPPPPREEPPLPRGEQGPPPPQPKPEPEAPPAPTPQQPPPPTPQAPQTFAAVNLGNADEDQEALSVTGKNVVPPRPDAAFHNKPPQYPADAARRGHEGLVLVRARVSEAGVPSSVDIITSSGDSSLDRAARDAVQLWRFTPARNNGIAVPFDYDVSLRFGLNDR